MKVIRKATPKEENGKGAMEFTTAKAASLQVRGPSGENYTFYREAPTLVTNRSDIALFLKHPDLDVYGSSSAFVNKKSKVVSSGTPISTGKIFGLKNEDQLDHDLIRREV